MKPCVDKKNGDIHHSRSSQLENKDSFVLTITDDIFRNTDNLATFILPKS